jgi:phage nucleotide-binding protein
MAVQLKSTRDSGVNGVKILVYGQAGAGKTTLIKTLPAPVILSAEAGLLSLADCDIPVIEIRDMADLGDAYMWLTTSEEAGQFKTVCLDSISEIAEVVLVNEKKVAKDPRQAYGSMSDQMASLVRSFRDLPGRNVYMSAKVEKTQDEMGRILYSPSMPGNKTGQALPYFFDEVFALRVERDPEGNPHRGLLCHPDGLWTAKDRSSRLNVWEGPDLGACISKIIGGSDVGIN